MERRKHPRRRVSPKDELQVTFKFKGGSVVDINVLNISKAGLLGYTSSIEHFIGIDDQNIEQIVITEAGKKPFKCSGRIMRVQPVLDHHRCYCAVEINSETDQPESAVQVIDGTDVTKDLTPPYRVIDDRPLARKVKRIDRQLKSEAAIDEELLARISKLECFFGLKDLKQEEELRQKAYKEFEDITRHLTIEEQWFFCDILEIMKRHEPNYPEDAKLSFLKLCRLALSETKENRPHVIVSDINKSTD